MAQLLGVQAEPRLVTALKPALAQTTWNTRLHLWEATTRAVGHAQPTAQDFVLQIFGTDVSLQTKHAYAKSAVAILKARGEDVATLRTYIRALSAQGATVPMHQAPPLTRDLIRQFLPTLDLRTATALRIAWKAAARWSEVAALQRHQWEIHHAAVLIKWGHGTKSSRTNPYSESMYAVLTGDMVEEIITGLQAVPQGFPLTTTTTSQLTSLLTRAFPLLKLTSHSVKRGAVTHLMGEAAAGRIDLGTIRRLAHHKELTTTLRYAGNAMTTALALGTQRATALL